MSRYGRPFYAAGILVGTYVAVYGRLTHQRVVVGSGVALAVIYVLLGAQIEGVLP